VVEQGIGKNIVRKILTGEAQTIHMDTVCNTPEDASIFRESKFLPEEFRQPFPKFRSP
jgi:hypothetical protein